MSIRPHKKLKVWQDAVDFVPKTYTILKAFPEDEKFGLSPQIRRASTSISINIAEGAARSSKKDFARFLYISMGSISELDTLFEISLKLKYLSQEEYDSLNNDLNNLSAMLNGLIKKLKQDIS